MRYSKKNNVIAVGPSDHELKIIAKNPRTRESIGFKIFYSDKGFGIEVFSQEEGTSKGRKMLMVSDKQKIFESSYIGIWKLKPSVTRRVKKKFGGNK